MNSYEPTTAEVPGSNSQPGRAASPSPAEITDCWKAIGVEGNGQCRELEKFIHCRNCPTYSSRGLQLLNRPLPEQYRREWTEHFAVKKNTVVAGRISVVVFRVGPEWLALPTCVFQEVAEHRLVHSIPHRRRGAALGLVNVRGELLLCVSVGWLLQLDPTLPPEKPRPTGNRLLVVAWDGRRLAFPADEVHGTHRFHPGEMTDPPATLGGAALTFTRGVFAWNDKTVGLLNPELLLSTLNRNLL